MYFSSFFLQGAFCIPHNSVIKEWLPGLVGRANLISLDMKTLDSDKMRLMWQMNFDSLLSVELMVWFFTFCCTLGSMSHQTPRCLWPWKVEFSMLVKTLADPLCVSILKTEKIRVLIFKHAKRGFLTFKISKL